MSISSHLESAEESIRQALINALAEGEEFYLTELFQAYQEIKDLTAKVNNTIRFTSDHDRQWAKDWSEYNFNLSSDYLNRPGGDLDALDNIVSFPDGNIHIKGGEGDDHITFS